MPSSGDNDLVGGIFMRVVLVIDKGTGQVRRINGDLG